MTRAQNVGFEEHVWWQESMPLKREGEMMFLVQLLPPTFCIFFLPFNLAKLSETDYMTSPTTMNTFGEASISRMRSFKLFRKNLENQIEKMAG